MAKDLCQHLEEYKENGFTIFEGLFSEAQMQKWREKHGELMADYNDQTWFGNMLEYAPKLMWPAVAHPTLLDFLELVMGPFVQLDNLTLAAFPTMPEDEAKGRASGWHRDRWAKMPQRDVYERPLAANAISYLQDLTDEYGPLRVIVGSHRQPITIPSDDRNKPHPDETLFYMKAGDVIVTHSHLIHSGTPSTANGLRYFFSIYYNSTWLKHTDNHSGPLTQRLLADARDRDDYRLMRLLGVDTHLQPRCNSGFLSPDEERWGEWIAEDKAAIKSES